MLLFVILATCIIANGYQTMEPLNFGILPGSGIDHTFYDTFKNKLKTDIHSPFGTTITNMNYCLFQKIPPNTILVGHSFGGFLALLYCVRETLYSESNIIGCVLINSHFNERIKMPYPGIRLQSVEQPTLVLLGRKDNKLPIQKAMDDYKVMTELSELYPKNKEFVVSDATHTSIFTDPDEMDLAIRNIECFVQNNIKTY